MKGMTFEHRKDEEPELGATIHTLVARHPEADSKGWGSRGSNPDWKNRAGHISWYETHDKSDPMNGEIGGVEVHPDHRRQGIATELHDKAKKMFPKLQHSEDLTDDGRAWSQKVAYGETKAPADVDTLRDPNCPVCGDDCFDGAECNVCGFVQPPKFLQDPDLEKAQQLDLRKQIGEEDPNALQKEQVQPNDVASPDDLNDDGSFSGQQAQPGSLPGEVQGEVQTAQTGMDQLGVPPQDQAGQVPLGPNGEPAGPQDLPPQAQDPMGKPFTPGPNMPEGPGDPEAPAAPGEEQQGLQPGFDGQTGTPQAADDAAQEALTCNSCGFQAQSTPPDSVDPADPDGGSDGTVAGDLCPYCQQGQLLSGAEAEGAAPAPPVVM